MSNDSHLVNEQLTEHIGELSGILFFLMGAMTIVELIDAHDGFEVITSRITTNNKRKLLWIISILTFFLSAALDNLTTAIVMVSLLRKLIDDKEDRLLFVGMVVIAANAGGAWSPIGDVTTTMLWIGGQVTAVNIMIKLIIPSLICLLVPLLVLSFKLKGNIVRPVIAKKMHPESNIGNRTECCFLFRNWGLGVCPHFSKHLHIFLHLWVFYLAWEYFGW
jgi:Na+/H+ antiporter NhaD/arsenite permease-like protein